MEHADRRHRTEQTPVFGVVDNASGQATAVAVHEVTAPMAVAIVRAVAAAEGTEVHTDGSSIYDLLTTLGYDHQKVIHRIGEYVDDNGQTTNHVENYWSTLKRIYVGTYHRWSPEHLHRYLEEHTFRFNRRRCHVVERMAEAAQSMSGKRLSWRQLTAHGHYAVSR